MNNFNTNALMALKEELEKDGYDFKGIYDREKLELGCRIIFPDKSEITFMGCKNEKEILTKAINIALNFKKNDKSKNYS